MTNEHHKIFLLLISVIFHCHGLDETEKNILETAASDLEADEELRWVNEFIDRDFITAFDRAMEYIHQKESEIDKTQRLECLSKVWNANHQKGYITEMEAIAMLKIARDWQVEAELMAMVRS